MVHVASLSGVQRLTFDVAIHLGYFRQEGFEVRVDETVSGSRTMEALLGGSVDVALTTYSQVLLAVSAGRDVASFFVITDRPMVVLAAAPGKPEIQRVEDLRGRTVGVTSLGAPMQLLLVKLLRVHGMTGDQVTPVVVGGGVAPIAALEHGKADAAFLNAVPFEILHDRHPKLRILADTRTPEGISAIFGVPAWPTMVLAASSRWLGDHREQTRGFGRAMARAAMWIRERPPEEVLAHVPEALRTSNAEAALRALRGEVAGYTIDGRMPEWAPAAARDYLSGSLGKDVSVELARTYTNEYLEVKP